MWELNIYAQVTNLKFAVMGGSSAETGAQRGASQLLAAAAFSGNGKNSGIRIVRFLESLGANFRCIADREKVFIVCLSFVFVLITVVHSDCVRC